MKTLSKSLPVEFKFFGKPKPFDKQSFETALTEFRDEAYDGIPENHNYPRARSIINDGINAIKTLLKNIWDTPEKLAIVKVPSIPVVLQVDNNYTAYFVQIGIQSRFYFTRYESAKSSNFDEAVQTEMEEMFQKYGFTESPLKKYRVKFRNHEVVLNELQVEDLRKEHPEFPFDIQEVK